MTALLAELFAEAQSDVVEWAGEPAYAVFELEALPDAFTIAFEAAVAEPVQGIRLKVRGAVLEVDGHHGSDVVLWRDTAPDRVRARVRRRTAKASLRVWNVWRGGLGVTQAWLGNAGMRVDVGSSGVIRLRCSDGAGPPDFRDLVATIAPDA